MMQQSLPQYNTDEIAALRSALAQAQAENAALRQELAGYAERLRIIQTAFDAFPESFWIKDASGRYLMVNQAFRHMHRLGDIPIHGRHPEEFLSDYIAIGIRRGDEIAYQQLEPYHNEMLLETPQGERIWIETIKQVIRSADGSPTGIIGTTRNVTARHEAVEARITLERTLHDSQRRESLGLLAGGIAHDFNNLLTSILGHAELGKLDINDDSPLAESLDHIINGARSAARLAGQLLAYAGKGRFLVQSLDFNQVILEIADLIRISLPKSSRVTYQLDPQLPPINADVTQIQQVVLNLITNAADALPEHGGQIQLITSLTYCDVATLAEVAPNQGLQPGAYVRLEVHDNGHGMDHATRKRIFDPFFSTKRTGRGLGLAAVQGIARAHNGIIAVQSMPGVGSCFTFWVPADKPQTSEHPPPIQTTPDRLKGRVLLVDDEPSVRLTLKRMLMSLGFQIDEADTGETALQMLTYQASQPHCIVLDLTMPGIGGAQTARILQRDWPHIPVILISGYHQDQIRMENQDIQAAAMLHKPIDLQGLRGALQQALRL